MPYVSAKPAAASEGAGFVEFTVSLDAAAGNEVRVSAQTVNINALANQDYTFFRDTLVFAPGETSKTVRVSLIDNLTAEGTETFWLQLYSPVNAQIEQPFVPGVIHDNDGSAGTPAISVRDVTIDEADGTARFFVSLSRLSVTPVSVSYSTADDNASAGSDYGSTEGLLSFAAGEMVKAVTVPLINDTLAEGDEAFFLRLSAPTGATIADGEAVALIGRNDGGATSNPRVFTTPIAVDETGTFASFAIQLSAPSQADVGISAQTVNISATANADYDFARDTMLFAPGQTLKTFYVPLLSDTTAEATELFWLQLYSPTNAAIPRPFTLASLFDNDAAAGTPAITAADAVVDESDQSARIVVSLSRPSAGTVTVAYASIDDSGRAGEDYLATGGSLSFAPGETVKTVVVKLVDDSLAEADESFFVRLSAPSGATLADDSATVTIAANDAAPVSTPYVYTTPVAVNEGDAAAVLTIRLSAPSTNEVRVSYQTDNETAVANGDFDFTRDTLIFAPGETAKVIPIPMINGTVAEPRESFYLQLYSPTNASLPRPSTLVTIADNDGTTGTPAISISDAVLDESAMRAEFFVFLDKPSVSTVTVAYASRDDDAAAGSDYRATSGTLSFAPGETVKTVWVDVIDDLFDETDEYFQLVLSAPANATLADATGTALIGRSDRAPTSTPYLLVSPIAVSEGSHVAVFTAQLSAPSSNEVRFSYQTDNINALANQDFAFSRQQLIFAPGETTLFIEVPLLDNTTAEPTELFYLQLYSLSNAIAPVSYVGAFIHDNDGTTGTPAISISDAAVDENAQSASFFITLNRPSTQTVGVRWDTAGDTASAGADFLGAGGNLSFAPGEMAKTVTVRLIDDSLTEYLEAFRVQLSAPANATLADATAVGFIGRSDGPTVSRPQISANALNVSEGDTTATWLVQLSAPSSNEVRVSWQTVNATAQANVDFPFDRQEIVFAPGETLRVLRLAITDDTAAESTETLTLQLYNPVNATLAQANHTVTLLDNDSGFTVLSQGLSNDTYNVTSALARIAESPGGGVDTVLASVSYTLPENVENLLLGAGASNGIGNVSNNIMRGNAGNNTLDGGGGIDTAVFGGPVAAYAIGGSATSRTVSGAGDGSDLLLGFERLQFADVIRASDTLPGQNTYLAYAMINAAFDRAPSIAELSMWTAQLDRLGNTRDLAQAMINFYAPGVPDEALVAHLWGTIVETPIPLDQLALYVGLVGNGTYTQAGLVELVATLDLNTVEIVGMVGTTLAMDPAYFPVPG